MAVLKKVHKGTVTFANTDTLKDGEPIGASISYFNSFLTFTVNGSSGGTFDAGRSFFRGWIKNSTSVSFSRATTADVGETFTIKWQVFEFESGVTVQSGSSNGLNASTSDDVTLSTPVDLTRAFPIMYASDSGDWTIGSEATIQLTSSTNLRAEAAAGALDLYNWQVVEFDDACTVQKVVATSSDLSSGTTLATKTINTVDMDKTFLIGSVKIVSGSTFQNQDRWVWYLSDANTVSFTRYDNSTTVNECVVYVVTINDDQFQVQRGTESFASGVETQIDVSLPSNNPLLETRSAGAILSGYPFNYSSYHDGAYDRMDGNIFTAEITDTSTLRLTREADEGDAVVYWQVLEWNRTTSTIYLSDLTEDSYVTDLGSLGKDVSVDSNTITVGGFTYDKGLGAHADCTIIYDLTGYGATRFKAIGGIDAETGALGSATWEVWNNDTNTKIAESGTLTGSADDTYEFDVDITGINSLKLINTDAGDGNASDHTDWADARIIAPATKTMINFLGTEIGGNRTLRSSDYTSGNVERWNYDDTANGVLFTDATGDRIFSGGIDSETITTGPFLNDIGFYSDSFGYFSAAGSGVASYAKVNILWIKDNFNNIEATDTVYCTAASKFTMVVDVSNNQDGSTELYAIIKDGGTWYINEDDLSEGATGTFTLENFNNNSDSNKRWSVFTPTATSFGKPASPSYAAHDFTNVQAVGFINEQSRAEDSHGFEISQFLFEASSTSGVTTRNVLFFGSNF